MTLISGIFAKGSYTPGFQVGLRHFFVSSLVVAAVVVIVVAVVEVVEVVDVAAVVVVDTVVDLTVVVLVVDVNEDRNVLSLQIEIKIPNFGP